MATDAALEWVCGEVERTGDRAPSDNLKGHLAWMLSRADIALLERHAERVLGLPAIGPEERQTVLTRLELAACAPAEAWRRLDDHCRMAVAGKTFADARIPEAELLLEPLVRAGSASIARVMDVLRAPLPTGTGDEPADRLVPDALAVLDEAPTDPERGETRELLVTFSYLSGHDLPERDAWERHVDAHDDRLSRFGYKRCCLPDGRGSPSAT